MRYIQKGDDAAASIREFIAVQMSQEIPVNLDYEQGFGRKAQLLKELIAEQFGLCAYTGLPVDVRLDEYNSDKLRNRGVDYRAHNEHIKSQTDCKREALAAGKSWGCEPCEDIDHRNIVAAVEVRGATSEQFGAVSRTHQPVPLPPTDSGCETEYAYSLEGVVSGTSTDSSETIDLLKLNHDSLKGYRRSWVSVFLSLDAWESNEDLSQIIDRVKTPIDGRLTKFSFCIASAASQILAGLEAT